MPKMKTHSGAKKRFSVTGTGKVKRTRSGKRHILTKKEKSRKLRLGHSAIVVAADMPRMRRLLVI